MGLDVYLYRYAKPIAETVAFEKRVADEVEAIWQREIGALGKTKYDQLTSTEVDAIRAKTKAHETASGLVDDEVPNARAAIKMKSRVHPEHMFEIGYLRSSYNSGGINHILEDRIGKSLGDIFEPLTDDEYHRSVDWATCLVRAREVRDEFAAYLKRNGDYEVLVLGHNPFIGSESLPTDAKAALEVFQKQRAREIKNKAEPFPGQDPDYHWYGTGEGEFRFGKPMRVVAMISGTRSSFTGRTEPCQYVVWEHDPDAKDKGMQWYRQATEIVVEMCEWVLSQPDPQSYCLHWSG